MMKQLWNDETGFVISTELVLVATILVIGLVVGLAEVQSAVVCELNDVGEAMGSLNQSYFYTGFAGFKNCWGGGWGFGGGGLKAYTPGSAFFDNADSCDFNECALACAGASAEYGLGSSWGGGTIREGMGSSWGGGTIREGIGSSWGGGTIREGIGSSPSGAATCAPNAPSAVKK